jgi:glycosyltransferase involved in cell wall biosynthesis
MNTKKLIYTLTTSYIDSSKSKDHFVFFEDKSLIDGGYRVKTITPHKKKLALKENVDSIQIHRFRYLPENYEISSSLPDALKTSSGKIKLLFLSLCFLFSTFSHCLKEKPDLILAHWAVPSGIIAFMMARIFKIKYIISIHGGDVAPLKNSNFLRKFVIKILNNSSCVIVNGGFTEKEFTKMGVKKNKLKIIFGPPNYVTHLSDTKQLLNFRNTITAKNTKIILTVARLTELKGIEYLIRSIPYLKYPNIHCLIVGTGELLNHLQYLAKSLQISEKITFFGRAGEPKLGWIYDISDVFVLPSIIDSTGATDAMPLVIPEAMESKLPVIGTNVGGIPFMIDHNENGLIVPPRDPILLAESIDAILSNDVFQNKIIQNSQKLVKNRTLKITHDKYIQVVHDALVKN